MCAKADAQEIIEIDSIETLSGTPECPHCHQQTLEEVEAGGSKKKMIMIISAVVVAVIAVVICILLFGNGPKKKRTKVNMASKPQTEAVTKDGKESADDVENSETADDIELSGAGTPAIEKPGLDAATDGKPVPGKPVEGTETSAAKEPAKEKTKTAEKSGTTKTTTAKNGHGTVNLGYGTYTGDLKNGKPHGHGVITYTKQHKIVSSKDFVANPGDTFEGDFREGRISSIGYWTHDGNQTAVKP